MLAPTDNSSDAGRPAGPGRRGRVRSLAAQASRPGAVAAISLIALGLAQGAQSTEAIAVYAIGAWWSVLVLGRARPSPTRGTPGAALAAGGCLLGLAVLAAASTQWTSDDGTALNEALRSAAYAGAFVLVIRGVRAGEGAQVLRGIAAGLVAIGMLALVARLLPGVIDGDRQRLLEFTESGGRLGYPVGYWNALAAMMAPAAILLSWIASSASLAGRRALAVAFLPPILLVIYFTGSRGGLLATALGVGVCALLAPVRVRLLAGFAVGLLGAALLALLASGSPDLVAGAGTGSARSAGAWLALATLAVAGAAAFVRLRLDRRLALPNLPLRLTRVVAVTTALSATAGLVILAGTGNRLADFSSLDVAPDAGRGQVTGRFLEPGGNDRVELWRTALDAFDSQPLHGIGAGAFATYWNQHGSLARPIRDAHSLFLEDLAEFGPLGLVFSLGFFGLGVVAALRRTYGDSHGVVAAAAGVLVAAALSVAVDWTWQVPAAALPAIIAVALLCGEGTLVGGREPPAARPRFQRGLGRLLLAAFATLTLVLAGTTFLGQRALDRSRELARAGDLAGSAEAADQAAALLPESAEPRLQLGLVQSKALDLDAAAASLRRAIARAPEDPIAWAALVPIYGFIGDDRFLSTVDRAAALSPQDRP